MAAKRAAKRPAHRPSEFNDKAPGLLWAIATTPKGIHRLHREDPKRFPSVQTVMRWLDERPEFREQYARAKAAQAELLASEIVAIADDSSRDFSIDPETGNPVTDHEHIQRSRLRVDSRKWLASKLLPRVYGEKVALGGDPDSPPIQVDTHGALGAKLDALAEKLSR